MLWNIYTSVITSLIGDFLILYNQLFWTPWFLYTNISFFSWSLGCWTLSLWVVHPAWLTWTKSIPTVLTPAWQSKTSRPKSPHIPSCRTWLVPTPPFASPPAQHLCSTSIPPAPTPVIAWVGAAHRCSTPSCLGCTVVWSPCPCRWACPPVQGLSKLRCVTVKRGVREPGELQAGHPSTWQMGRSHLCPNLYLWQNSIISFALTLKRKVCV